MQHESNCKLSNPAKLLKALMAATGVCDAKELADTLCIPVRTIQRLKLEIATVQDDIGASATSANDAIYGASDSAKRAINGVSDAISGANGASRTYARMESPSGILIPKKLDSPFFPQDPYAQVWRDENGRLVLSDEYRADWVNRFGGDAARLELAITQAEGYLQPNNRTKSLDVQLASQLARIVAEKRDRDTRYASAAAANQPAKANGQPSATLAAMDRIKARMAAGAPA
jgi:hypothetical protein